MTGTHTKDRATRVELLERIDFLEQALESARHEAMTDPLTGLANRRAWELALAKEEARCTRHDMDAVVAVVDLDGFKAVNDGAGHHAGDEVLVRAAEALARAVRGSDLLARVGGDEFAVLAVQAHATATQPLERRLARALQGVGVAATVGACALSAADSLEDAWRAADRGMIARKGRTRKPASR